MSAFLLISQSLRTGEPLHQSQSQDLVERAFYHGSSPATMPGVDEAAIRDSRLKRLQSVTDYEYMFYASSVVAVFRMLEVRISIGPRVSRVTQSDTCTRA